MLKVEIATGVHRTLEGLLENLHVVRVRSLQDQLWRRFRPGRIPINPRRFFGPEYPLGAHLHSDATGVAESLRIGEVGLAAPKFQFRALLCSDIHHRADDFDISVTTSLGLPDDMQIFDLFVRRE